jgi:glutamate synthase (NADPH/NADH) small chain
MYGIPSFKLPKNIVEEKIAYLERIGVQFVTNTRIGEATTVKDLLDEYDAVFLGTGANVDAAIKIPGLELEGVYQATDFLVRANVPSEFLPPDRREKPVVGSTVVVIGGGDTAMDCVRTAIRLQVANGIRGGTVTCVYRRTEAEMPGCLQERIHAQEEGGLFEYLTAPVALIGDDKGHVKAMQCIRMELGEPDESGRRRPVPIEGSEFEMEVDTVILAIGYWPDPLIGETTDGLETHRWGLIVADEHGRTSVEGVFAAGDNVKGPDLVVTALAAAGRAADAIHEYLSGASHR